MPLSFRDPAAERAFRLEYAGGSATRHLRIVVGGTVLLLIQLVMVLMGKAAVPVEQVLLSLGSFSSCMEYLVGSGTRLH
jgi:hypothetical protein